MSLYDQLAPALGEALGPETCRVNKPTLRNLCEQIEWARLREMQELRDSIARLQVLVAAYKVALSPSEWRPEHSVAWCGNASNLEEAFAALHATVTGPRRGKEG